MFSVGISTTDDHEVVLSYVLYITFHISFAQIVSNQHSNPFWWLLSRWQKKHRVTQSIRLPWQNNHKKAIPPIPEFLPSCCPLQWSRSDLHLVHLDLHWSDSAPESVDHKTMQSLASPKSVDHKTTQSVVPPKSVDHKIIQSVVSPTRVGHKITQSVVSPKRVDHKITQSAASPKSVDQKTMQSVACHKEVDHKIMQCAVCKYTLQLCTMRKCVCVCVCVCTVYQVKSVALVTELGITSQWLSPHPESKGGPQCTKLVQMLAEKNTVFTVYCQYNAMLPALWNWLSLFTVA